MWFVHFKKKSESSPIAVTTIIQYTHIILLLAAFDSFVVSFLSCVCVFVGKDIHHKKIKLKVVFG